MSGLHVLVGVGGPNVPALTAALAGIPVTWVHAQTDLVRPSRDSGLLAASGRVLVLDEGRPADIQVLEDARRHGTSGILTFSESSMGVCATVAEELGLRFHDVATTTRLTDKLAQRRALEAAGVPSTAYAAVSAATVSAPPRVSYPAVLKPRRGGGSKLTAMVESWEEARSLLTEAESVVGEEATRASRVLHATQEPGFLLETMLLGIAREHCGSPLGDYVSVDTLVVDGVPTHDIVMDKLPQAPGFRERGHLAPSSLPPGEASAVVTVAHAAISALGVRHGWCHTELKLTSSGPAVIEVNGRSGGGTHGLVAAGSTYNVVREAARAALGEPVGDPPRFDGVGALLVPCLPIELSGKDLDVRLDPALPLDRRAVQFHDLHVRRFDARLGQGIAAMVYARGRDHADILDYARAIDAGISVWTDSPAERSQG